LQSRSAIAASGEPSSTPSLTASPRSTSSRATWDPMKPVAPVTRVSANSDLRRVLPVEPLEAVSELRAAHAVAFAVHCEARALQLFEPCVEASFDALPLLHGTRVYGVGHDTSK
jgi:hypothetical protein